MILKVIMILIILCLGHSCFRTKFEIINNLMFNVINAQTSSYIRQARRSIERGVGSAWQDMQFIHMVAK